MSHAQRMRRRRRGSGGPRNKAFLGLMVVGILVVLAGLGGVGYVVSIAASAPPLSSLKPKATGDNTRVFAADGRPLGFIQADELHLPLRSKDIPQVVKDATVAIEDERFYDHNGVDYEGVVRAAVKNVTSRKTVQGGSTITMQLVRSLYISSERTYTRKIREAKLAEELEDDHSKAWILEKYLDSIPYGTVGGQSAIGIKAAAKIYFSKNLEDLNLNQAALLAGLPQAPSDYSPTRSKQARQGAPQRGAAQDGRAAHDHRREGRDGDRQADRPEALDVLLQAARGVLLRLREGPALPRVRRADGARGRDEGLHDDRPQQAGRGARHDLRPPGRHRPLLGDRDAQPAQRLHRGDGVVGRLRPVELQPRRPGAPAPGLDVQGDGADGGAAPRRRPRLDALHVHVADDRRGPDLRQLRDQDVRRHGRRQPEPAPGDA